MPKPARVQKYCIKVALEADFYFEVRMTVPWDGSFPPTLVTPPCRTVLSATGSLDGTWCRSSLLTDPKPLSLSLTSMSTWTSYLTQRTTKNFVAGGNPNSFPPKRLQI